MELNGKSREIYLHFLKIKDIVPHQVVNFGKSWRDDGVS